MSTATTPASTLAQTEAALAGPLPALTPSAALGVIDSWRTACRAADTPDALAVADGLDGLRALLSADRLDGQAVGACLRGLARATRAVPLADAAKQPRLKRIADLLDQGAASLGG